MSIKKIVGIETELRLDCVDPENDKNRKNSGELEDYVLPGSVVKNALSQSGGVVAVGSDTQPANLQKNLAIVENLKKLYPSSQKAIQEHLENRSARKRDRGISEEDCLDTYQRFGLSGGYTFSGFRIYVDGTHPEVSTPECATPFDLVCRQKAGERIIEEGRKKTEEETGRRITLSADNSDGLGGSWGSHENYLVSDELFESLTEEGCHRHDFRRTLNSYQDFWASFLVTRFVFCGSGKMGSEIDQDLENKFLISQRAEFISCNFSHRTMEHRPIINLRDIPYVGPGFGRRLHVIIGDSNMCEPAIYLKVGTAMIMLMMLEDNFISEGSFPIFEKPVKALQTVMSDVDCSNLLDVYVGGQFRHMTAIDIQKFFCELAAKWLEERFKNTSDKKSVSWVSEVLFRLDQVLTKLKNDPMDLFGTIDWVTKYGLCCSELENRNAGWTDVTSRSNPLFRRLIGICGAYHRLDELGIYNKLEEAQEVERIVQDVNIHIACLEPPQGTRAFERGKFLRHFRDDIYLVNWNLICIKRNPYKIFLNSPYSFSPALDVEQES